MRGFLDEALTGHGPRYQVCLPYSTHFRSVRSSGLQGLYLPRGVAIYDHTITAGSGVSFRFVSFRFVSGFILFHFALACWMTYAMA
jgi:hypothetical protein